MSLVQPYERKETLVSVQNVSRKLGTKQVLRDLSFDIRNLTRPGMNTGQVIALLGPSGMGKTTLFRILAGLDQPDSGSVQIGAEGKPVERGMVGVVFQNYVLFEHRTVLSNLAIAARRGGHERSTATTKAKESLERFGLSECIDRYPAQLSGGQRQRVAIAQQFLCSQFYLLMDEPFSGLDPLATDHVCQMVNEVANMHDWNTIFVVTHNIEAALEVADTVLLLGRDRDSSGQPVVGARVQEQYDLIARGLAWRHGIDQEPEFSETLREIRARFRTL